MGRGLSRLYLADLFDLSGHLEVVTGGNGGIGRSIALGLGETAAASPRAPASRTCATSQ
jgi:NAD(P)-dependent dehydrogenase (short-subunit alcohol dehydrogenase family)